jgi:hypothetical protein
VKLSKDHHLIPVFRMIVDIHASMVSGEDFTFLILVFIFSRFCSIATSNPSKSVSD